MIERRRDVPLLERRGFWVISLLMLLVATLWGGSALVEEVYPRLSAFLWREGWFFIALAVIYRICLSHEEKKIIAKRYGRNDDDMPEDRSA
jgi:hypothetical protein